MAEVVKTVLVPYSPQQMFDLVDGVERYPEFLPWCGATRLLHRDAGITRATLTIAFKGVKQSFTTDNPKTIPTAMDIRLVEGPFRRLDGSWRFTDLGGQGCRIEFRLSYELASRILDKLIGPVFGHIANTLVEAFIRRAEQVYG